MHRSIDRRIPLESIVARSLIVDREISIFREVEEEEIF